MRPPQFPAERLALSPGVPKDVQSKIDGTGVAQKDQGPARILVVEDDFLIALQTETAPTDAGFHVVGTATSAEEAIALAKAAVFGTDGYSPR